MGEGRTALTIDQVTKKWSDLKSKSKSAVMNYKKSMGKTGGGSNSVKKPSEVHYKVTAIVGKAATEIIPGTAECDTSAKTVQNNQLALIRPPQQNENSSTGDIVMELNSEEPTPSHITTPLSSKRSRFCPKNSS